MTLHIEIKDDRTLLERVDAALEQLANYPLNDSAYGHFAGGDPRRFHPDSECCTPEELAAHEAACAAWDRGEEIDYSDQVSGWIGGEEYFVPTSCGFATGRPEWTEIIHVTRSPFGIGTQEYGIHDDVEPLLHEMRALLTGDRP